VDDNLSVEVVTRAYNIVGCYGLLLLLLLLLLIIFDDDGIYR